jgi:hypothetical protein
MVQHLYPEPEAELSEVAGVVASPAPVVASDQILPPSLMPMPFVVPSESGANS